MAEYRVQSYRMIVATDALPSQVQGQLQLETKLVNAPHTESRFNIPMKSAAEMEVYLQILNSEEQRGSKAGVIFNDENLQLQSGFISVV